MIDYVAADLRINDVSFLAKYGNGETLWDHKEEIRQRFGYRPFINRGYTLGFIRWLYTRSLTSKKAAHDGEWPF